MATNLSFANSLYLRFFGVDASKEQRRALTKEIAELQQADTTLTEFDITADFVADNFATKHSGVIAQHIVDYYTHFTHTPDLTELLNWASQDPTKSSAEIDDLKGYMVYDVYATSLNNVPIAWDIMLPADLDSIDENEPLDYTVTISGAAPQSIEYSLAENSDDDSRFFNIDSTSGKLSFKQAPDFEEKDTYDLTVFATDTETSVDNFQAVSISINNVNEAPQLTPPPTSPVVAAENSTAPFYTVEATDPENDALTFTINNLVDNDNHLFTINDRGALSFISAPDFESDENNNGEKVYLVDVAVSDGFNSPVTQEVRVTVADIDEAPPVLTLSAANGGSSLSVTEGEIASYKVALTSGHIAAGETLTFTLDAINGAGPFGAVNPDDFTDFIDLNTATYTFNHTFTEAVSAGTTVFTFSLVTTDDDIAEEQEQFKIALSLASINSGNNTVTVATNGTPLNTVINDNDIDELPTAVDDLFATKDNQILTNTVVSNDNPGDTPSVFSNTTEPAHGSLLFNDDGSFTYTPETGFSGTDSFDYQITDVDGDTATATVNIEVVANKRPTAVNDLFATKDNQILTNTVVSNDNLGDTPAVFAKTTEPVHGSLVFNNNGSFIYTPESGFSGTDSFGYQITDADGDIATATVAIEVVANKIPTAVNDLFSIKNNQILTNTVVSNDNLGDTPAVFSNTTEPAHGSVVFNNNGSFTYTPEIEFSGTDGFDYQSTDADGDIATATVNIEVVANKLPTAVDDLFSTKDNQILTNSVVPNDNLGDTPAVFANTTEPTHGLLVFNNDGTFTYTPNLGFSGTDSFDYQITDADEDIATATVNIEVIANKLPTAVDDLFSTKNNQILTNTVVPNDTLGDPTSIFANTTEPAHGSLLFNNDGSFTYTPDIEFSGTDSFNYQITDTDGDIATATVNIDVVANKLPTAVDDLFATKDNQILTNTVVSNDNLGDTPAVFAKTTEPTHGSVIFNDDGTFTYTPNLGFSGTDSFDYQITDVDGDIATATVAIEVVANKLPVAVDDLFATKDNQILTNTVVSNDNLGDPPAVFAKTTEPAHGLVVFNGDGTFTYTPNLGFSGIDGFDYQITDVDGDIATATVNIEVTANKLPIAVNDLFATKDDQILTNTVVSNDNLGDTPAVFENTTEPAHGLLVFNNDGTFTYTPNLGFSGTDSFDYQITDVDGEISTATVAIEIVVNRFPGAVDDLFSIKNNQILTNTVVPNDSLGDTPNVFANTTEPAHGSLLFNNDGSFTYTPDIEFSGTDSFDYQITDADGDTTSATVNIEVVANKLPVAVDDLFSTKDNQILTNTVVSNDNLGDTPAVLTKTTEPAHGSVVFNNDGTFAYTPNLGFSGADSFDYQITDADGDIATATVNIEVAANKLPTAVDDLFSTKDNQILTNTVASNDNLGDTPAVFAKTTEPAHGSLVFNNDGSFTYTPDLGFSGTDSFDYQITDTDGDIATATANIEVVANKLPVAVDDLFSTILNQAVINTVVSNDNLGDTPAVFANTTNPAHGSLLFNTDGSFTYTPDTGFSGTDSFDYQITDKDGDTDIATVNITITGTTFNFTTNADDLSGSAGDDIFIADNTLTQTTSSTDDSVDGKAGFDELLMFVDSTNDIIFPGLVNNIELVTIESSGTNLFEDVDFSTLAGVTSIDLSTFDLNGGGNRTLTLGAWQELALNNIINSGGGAGNILDIVQDTGQTYLDLSINGLGVGGHRLDINLEGSGLEALYLFSTGVESDFTLQQTGTQLNEIYFSGNQRATIVNNSFNASGSSNLTINTSTATNGVHFAIQFDNHIVDFIGGPGDDIFSAEDTDTIDGGTGFDIARFEHSVSTINLLDDDLINIENVLLDKIGGSYDFSVQTEDLFIEMTRATVVGSNITGGTLIGGLGDDLLSGWFNNDTFTGGAGADTFGINFSNADRVITSDIILDFSIGEDKISSDFDGFNQQNISNPSSIQLVASIDLDNDENFIANSGLVIIDNGNLNVSDAPALATIDVALYLGSIEEGGDTFDNVVFENKDSLFYLLVSNGIDAGLYRADAAAGNSDTIIDANELTLIATIQGINDAGSLSGSFLDFF